MGNGPETPSGNNAPETNAQAQESKEKAALQLPDELSQKQREFEKDNTDLEHFAEKKEPAYVVVRKYANEWKVMYLTRTPNVIKGKDGKNKYVLSRKFTPHLINESGGKAAIEKSGPEQSFKLKETDYIFRLNMVDTQYEGTDVEGIFNKSKDVQGQTQNQLGALMGDTMNAVKEKGMQGIVDWVLEKTGGLGDWLKKTFGKGFFRNLFETFFNPHGTPLANEAQFKAYQEAITVDHQQDKLMAAIKLANTLNKKTTTAEEPVNTPTANPNYKPPKAEKDKEVTELIKEEEQNVEQIYMNEDGTIKTPEEIYQNWSKINKNGNSKLEKGFAKYIDRLNNGSEGKIHVGLLEKEKRELAAAGVNNIDIIDQAVNQFDSELGASAGLFTSPHPSRFIREVPKNKYGSLERTIPPKPTMIMTQRSLSETLAGFCKKSEHGAHYLIEQSGRVIVMAPSNVVVDGRSGGQSGIVALEGKNDKGKRMVTNPSYSMDNNFQNANAVYITMLGQKTSAEQSAAKEKLESFVASKYDIQQKNIIDNIKLA